MEEMFNKLKGEKRNSVNNLIKWMQDSKIIPKDKPAEDKARQLFNDVKDAGNVELTKFQEALGKLATEQKKTIGEFSNTLATEGSKFMQALTSAAVAGAGVASTTLKEAMKK